MCGLFGSFDRRIGVSPWIDLTEVTADLRHRGPDSNGTFEDASANLQLVHTRLAIQGLGETGSQPMISFCGRYVMVYNGEIFNLDEIEPKIQKFRKPGKIRSDTRLLLELFVAYGPSFTRFIKGMYAIAVWDKVKKQINHV